MQGGRGQWAQLGSDIEPWHFQMGNAAETASGPSPQVGRDKDATGVVIQSHASLSGNVHLAMMQSLIPQLWTGLESLLLTSSQGDADLAGPWTPLLTA